MALPTKDCFAGLDLLDQLAAIYEALYVLASDDNLTSPECFKWQDRRTQITDIYAALVLISDSEDLPTPECFFGLDIADQLQALYEASIGISGGEFDPEAQDYFDRSGVTDPVAKTQINSFIIQAKPDGYWDLLDEAWLLRAAQNAGSGSTAYALKSGANNGTLVNAPPWGANGITFASASSQQIATPFTSNAGNITIFSTSSHLIGASNPIISQDDTVATRRFAHLCNATAPNMNGYVFNSAGFQQPVIGYVNGAFRSLIMRCGASMFRLHNFVDAEQIGTAGVVDPGAGLTISIGARAGGLFADGTIAHVMHFSAVLSDVQKANLYDNIKATIGSGLGLP